MFRIILGLKFFMIGLIVNLKYFKNDVFFVYGLSGIFIVCL